LWSGALLAGFTVAIVFLAISAHGINDYKGRPLGSDFSNVYAAGRYVLEGKPAAPFDPMRQLAEERAIFGKATQLYGWHYPPFFLLVAAPLASLAYIPALILWQASTFLLYLAALAALLRSSPAPALVKDWRWLLLAIAFPAVFVNLGHGHNGFLTAALLAGGLAFLAPRPILAGVLFGLLAYKPQFAVAIPLALLVTGRWRTLAAAAFTVAALAGVVTALFGTEVWSAFLASTHFTRTVVLEQGNTGFNKIQSVFAWTRLWGGSVPLAYAMQGIASTAAAAALVIIWRRPASFADRGAALCLAALLTTPYCLDYDLMVLAPAIALLGAQGMEHGFRPYEKSLLVLLWLVPILARNVAAATLIPLGPMTLLLAGYFLLRDAGMDPAGDRNLFFDDANTARDVAANV
jgi:hypothetical protein